MAGGQISPPLDPIITNTTLVIFFIIIIVIVIIIIIIIIMTSTITFFLPLTFSWGRATGQYVRIPRSIPVNTFNHFVTNTIIAVNAIIAINTIIAIDDIIAIVLANAIKIIINTKMLGQDTMPYFTEPLVTFCHNYIPSHFS